MKFISKPADAAVEGDLMVMPKRSSLCFTSVGTLRKFGMSIGDTCRSQNETRLVRRTMLADRTVTLFLVVEVTRTEAPDDENSLTLTSTDLGETPRGRLQMAKLFPLSDGLDVKWAAAYDAVLEHKVWQTLMEGREMSPFNLARTWRGPDLKMRAWKPEVLDTAWDQYRHVPSLRGNPLDPKTPCTVPSWTGAFPEWVSPDIPTGPFATDGLIFGNKLLWMPRTAVRELGKRGMYVARPDAGMADHLVRRAASTFARIVLEKCGTSLRLADALQAALKRDKSNMADAMRNMAAWTRRLETGSSAAEKEIKKL